MDFYETKKGQDFFTRQIPQLIEVLQEIAAALKRPAAGTRAVDRRPIFPISKIWRTIFFLTFTIADICRNRRHTERMTL